MTRAAPIEARRDAERAPAHGLILASRSPQRRVILEQLGVVFSVVEPEVSNPAGPVMAASCGGILRWRR